MVYIKANNDNSVLLGGTIATEEMLADGWVEYNGEIPTLSDYQSFKIESDALVVVTDTEALANAINTAIQDTLDTKAKELRYNDMASARSYTGYTNPFQEEAVKLSVWSSDCWAKAGQIEADVEAGVRPVPTVKEVLAEMPAYA